MRQTIEKQVDEDLLRVPEHMREPIKQYVLNGREPGGFLRAVILNNLVGALSSADTVNKSRLEDIVRFFTNDAPAACWGNVENYKSWKEQGGLYGIISACNLD